MEKDRVGWKRVGRERNEGTRGETERHAGSSRI